MGVMRKALMVLASLVAGCGAAPMVSMAPYAEDPAAPSLAVHYVSHAPEMHERLNKIGVQGESFSHHDTRYLWGRQSFWELSHHLTWNQPTPEAKVTALARWVSLNVTPLNTGDMPRERGVFPETVYWRGFGDSWECFLVFHALCRQAGIDSAYWVDSRGEAPSEVLAHGPEGWWRVDLEEGCLVMGSSGIPLTLEEKLADLHPSTLAVLRIPVDARACSQRWKAAAKVVSMDTPAQFHDDMELMERHLRPLLPRGGRIEWVDAIGQGMKDWLDDEVRASAFMMARVTQGGSLPARALLLAGRAREALGLYETLAERDDIDDFYEAQAAFASRRGLHAWEKFQKTLQCPYLRRLQDSCHRHLAILKSGH